MAMAQVDPQTLRMNLGIIIGGVFFAAMMFAGLIAAWTVLRAVISEIRRRRSWAAYRLTYGTGGREKPLAAAGICDVCGGRFDQVFFLGIGVRSCVSCFAEVKAARERLGAMDSVAGSSGIAGKMALNLGGLSTPAAPPARPD